MTRQFVLCVVLAVTLPGDAAAQLRKPVDAPIAFPQCGGSAHFEYQVERLARFQPDSMLDVAPADTIKEVDRPVQFVVDSSGRVIPGSLYMLTATPATERDQIATWLPRWRYTPAMVGGRATCQVIQTFVRRRDRKTHH